MTDDSQPGADPQVGPEEVRAWYDAEVAAGRIPEARDTGWVFDDLHGRMLQARAEFLQGIGERLDLEAGLREVQGEWRPWTNGDTTR